MNPDWMILLILSGVFLLLFGIAELLYVICKVDAEYTRKFVHTGTGLLTLLFPIYLHHVWQVIFICLTFFILLMISKKYKFFKAVNAISRKSAGSILYPVIVTVAFVFYKYMSIQVSAFDGLLYFYLPILLMAICDPVAAFAGTWYKTKQGYVTGKTWFGSLSFFITALLLSTLLYYCTSSLSLGIIIVYSLLSAFITTVAERYSGGGWDNFTIPLAAMILLYVLHILYG